MDGTLKISFYRKQIKIPKERWWLYLVVAIFKVWRNAHCTATSCTVQLVVFCFMFQFPHRKKT